MGLDLDGCRRVRLNTATVLGDTIVALQSSSLAHLVHGWAGGSKGGRDRGSPRRSVTTLHEHLELVGTVLGDRRDGLIAVRRAQCPSLGHTDLVLGGTEDTTGGSLLLEHLLLMCV